MREERDDLIFVKSSLCVGESVQILGTISRSCLSLIVSVPPRHAVVPCLMPAYGCSVYDTCNVCVKYDQSNGLEEGKNKS